MSTSVATHARACIADVEGKSSTLNIHILVG